LTEYVLRTGKALLASPEVFDVLVEQGEVESVGAPSIDWLGVPLKVENRIIGVMAVQSYTERVRYGEKEMNIMEFVSTQVAIAIERKRSFEEIRRHLQRLNALRIIDVALTSSFDLRLNLSVLLEQVLIQLAVDAADVLLLNPYTLTLDYVAESGFRTRAAESVHIRLGESFAGRVALERCAVQLDNSTQMQGDPIFAALWAGEGFAAYYAVPLIAKGQVKGVLEIFRRAPLTVERDWVSFLETLAGQAAIAIENAQLFDHLERSNVDLALAYDATIEGWARALDLRDKETEGHTKRVAELTERLARAMGISEAEIIHIRRGALLHDIGKMGMPDSILLKPDKLTDEEWGPMRQHPQYAFDMLAPIAYLRPALDIPYCHHEKWDGTGYPRGLKGEQIPLAARLFAVVDVFDALISKRPYRPALPIEEADQYIREQAGKHFDPKAVEAFRKMQHK
jgi:HD-GYP domain-containing protein (c-di-GMP phosphodiesterase class II)